MANIEDLIRDLKGLRNDIRRFSPQLTFELVSDALAYIETRWVTTGQDAENVKKGYSQKKFSAGLMFRRTDGKGEAGRKVQQFNKSTYKKLYKIAGEGGKVSYKDIRQLDGKQTSHKDFRLTGQFWKSIQVQEVSRNGVRYDFTIDSTSERGQQILEWTKEGKQDILILDLTDEELNLLSLDLQDRINEIFRNRL